MLETETPVVEAAKPSKLARVRNTALTAGIFVIPSVVMVGASVMGYKTSLNNLEAAKLAYETAKLSTSQA